MKTVTLSPKYRRKVIKKKKKTTVSIIPRSYYTENLGNFSDRFVESVKKKGATEKGQPIIFNRVFEETLRAIADFRIGETYVTGNSQGGKTLSNTLLACFCLEELQIDVLWAYDLQASRDIQVPSNFHPVIKEWLKKAKRFKTDGSKNITIYQVLPATAQFTYVSTSSTTKKDGRAAAGGVNVGVSRDILFKEERSQYPQGAGDPLNRRLDAGKIITKPHREIGTPGGGGGIEAQIEQADHFFYPHTKCNHCKEIIELNPKGCLLKPKTVKHQILGNQQKYLTESGRPLDWYHHDPENPLDTAYYGCPSCGGELSQKARESAWLQCTRSGTTLKDYLRSLPDGVPKKRRKIGLSISPLLRISEVNLAAEIIKEGFDTGNTNDWQQQALGLPSESSSNKITLAFLKQSIGAPTPYSQPDIVLGGIDCGRGQHWLTRMGFYLPEGH